MRSRNPGLERELDALAARSVGFPSDGGLGRYADQRALPGGVHHRNADDWDREVAEELADARNYCVWGIEAVWAQVQAGDAEACDQYERRLRALSRIIGAWHDLFRSST